MSKSVVVLLVFIATSYSAQWEGEVNPIEIARVPTYTEGVVVDHDGNLYVSHADHISKITPEGELSLWAQTPSPNGHKVLANGTHLVCDREGAVYLLDADGQILRAVAELETGANDLTLDPANGGFYFTSPYGSSQENPIGKVYYVDSEERSISIGLTSPPLEPFFPPFSHIESGGIQ